MRVVIVGGGVIGLACAYELRKRGAEVAVIEARQVGAAASWGNAGWIVPSLSGPVPEPGLTLTALRWLLKADSPLYIKPRLDPGFVRWLWTFWRRCNLRDFHAGLHAMAALNGRTMDLYDAWKSEGVGFEMRAAGLLFAFVTPGTMRTYVDEVGQMREHGYDRPELLSGDEIRGLEPLLSHEVVGGFLIERERHVDPGTLTAGLASRLEANGAEIRTGTAVTGLRAGKGGVDAVETSHGPIGGDAFLLAAGAWSAGLARMAGFRLPVESGKGYSITIEDPDVKLAHPLYLGESKVGISPFAASLRIAGTMELSGLSEDVNQRRLQAIRRSVARYLTVMPRGRQEIEWAGMRPLTPDGLPALGRAPNAPNLFVATGHSMLGITLAPATGTALAELICDGRVAVDLSPFDPGRFAARHLLKTHSHRYSSHAR